MSRIKSLICKLDLYKIVLGFLVIQPVLDILMAIYDERISVFGFSVVTLVRLFLVFIIFVIALFKDKSKKRKYILFSYLLLVLIYSVIHLFRFVGFNFSLIGKVYNSSFLYNEAFYLVRMTIPVVLIYAFSLEKYDAKKVNSIFIITTLVISLAIIISNLLHIGFLSYSSDNNGKILFNFFDWFIPSKITVSESKLMTKGFFVSANQLSILQGILLFINIYLFSKRKSIINFVSTILLIISMYIVGTRVASYGALLITIVSFITVLFVSLISKNIKKDKKNIILCLLLICVSFFVYQISPIKGKYDEIEAEREQWKEEFEESQNKENNEFNNGSENKPENNKPIEDKPKPNPEVIDVCLTSKYSDRSSENIDIILNATEEEKNKFISCNIKYFPIYNYFMQNYYPSSNSAFWIEMMKNNYEDSMDTRKVKKGMVNNVKVSHNKKLDNLFGIGYTTLKNFVYLENDIICQFYSLGIIGIIIFIMPYLVVAVYAILKLITKLNKWTVRNIIYIGLILFAYCVSYLAGHMFDEFFTMFYLSFICGQLIHLEDINEKS